MYTVPPVLYSCPHHFNSVGQVCQVGQSRVVADLYIQYFFLRKWSLKKKWYPDMLYSRASSISKDNRVQNYITYSVLIYLGVIVGGLPGINFAVSISLMILV